MDLFLGIFFILFDGLKDLAAKPLGFIRRSFKGYFVKNTFILDFFTITSLLLISIFADNNTLGIISITVLPVVIIGSRLIISKKLKGEYHPLSTFLMFFIGMIAVVLIYTSFDEEKYHYIGHVPVEQIDIDDGFVVFEHKGKTYNLDVSNCDRPLEYRVIQKEIHRGNGTTHTKYISECDRDFSAKEEKENEAAEEIRRNNKQAKKLKAA